MNLLEPLPTRVAGLPIRAGFRTMLAFEALLAEEGLTEAQRIARAFALFYTQQPTDVKSALEGLLWFYGCGKKPKETREEPGLAALRRPEERAYDLLADGPYIFAGFYGQYGLDLTAMPTGFCYLYDNAGNICGSRGLHWWQFMALFHGLTPEQEMVKIMGYRVADTHDLPKKERARMERLKQAYSLPRSGGPAPDYATYRQSMLDYVAARYAKAQGQPEDA